MFFKDRKELINAFRSLVYAKNEEDFLSKLESFDQHHTVMKYHIISKVVISCQKLSKAVKSCRKLSKVVISWVGIIGFVHRKYLLDAYKIPFDMAINAI